MYFGWFPSMRCCCLLLPDANRIVPAQMAHATLTTDCKNRLIISWISLIELQTQSGSMYKVKRYRKISNSDANKIKLRVCVFIKERKKKRSMTHTLYQVSTQMVLYPNRSSRSAAIRPAKIRYKYLLSYLLTNLWLWSTWRAWWLDELKLLQIM